MSAHSAPPSTESAIQIAKTSKRVCMRLAPRSRSRCEPTATIPPSSKALIRLVFDFDEDVIAADVQADLALVLRLVGWTAVVAVIWSLV